jgi:hypothetical protein
MARLPENQGRGLGVFLKLQDHLRRHHVTHLIGVQLALVAVLCVSVVMVVSATAAEAHLRAEQALETARLTAARGQRVTPASLVDPAAATGEPTVIGLQDLSPDAARIWNASHPIDPGPNPAAKPFNLTAEGVLDEARAIDCMTAAIYYEAGFESLDGQRAVAQVVINRLRNPLFPKTVCGVVFQGAERTTGCQFTFTCDGALGREPQKEVWDRARKVAEAALHGYVMKKVGNATHYHADYVAPYWSPTLVKVAVIGQHIFYRWTGGMGLPPAFAGRYAGGETGGLQIATLDNLAPTQGQSAPALPEAEAPPPVEVASVAEEAPPPAPAAHDEPLVTPAAVAETARTIVKADDLDWRGLPKDRGAPRVARPSGSLGPKPPGGF